MPTWNSNCLAGATRPSGVARMVSVVSAHSSPASRPNKSPSQAWGSAVLAGPSKPSPRASPTPAKAPARPSHCQPRSPSPGTKRGSSSATQKGEQYKNTVRREAVVYCSPM